MYQGGKNDYCILNRVTLRKVGSILAVALLEIVGFKYLLLDKKFEEVF